MLELGTGDSSERFPPPDEWRVRPAAVTRDPAAIWKYTLSRLSTGVPTAHIRRGLVTSAAAGLLLGGLALWLLMSGRWGSYVGAPPVYLSDVVIALAALLLAARATLGPLRLRLPPATVLVCIMLSVWALVRMVWSPALTQTALRDLAPYLYAAVAGLTFLAGENRLWRSHTAVLGVLALHPAWLVAVTWFGVGLSGLPRLGGVPALTPRPDFDSAVCGVIFVVFLHYAAHTRRLVPTVLATSVAVVSLVLVFTLPTRAGLLATAAASAVWISAHAPTAWRGIRTQHRAVQGALLSLGALLLVTIIASVPRTTAGSRFVEAASGNSEAFGTSHARQLVWDRLVDYLIQEPARWLTGVGFGPDFLRASGTLQFLEGDRYDGVRSPHLYLLGTWARLGLPGLLLAAAVTVLGIALAFRAIQRGTTSVLTVTAAATAVAIPVVASFGVVLESPFGAIPYFWSIGHLAAWHRRASARRLSGSPRSADGVAGSTR